MGCLKLEKSAAYEADLRLYANYYHQKFLRKQAVQHPRSLITPRSSYPSHKDSICMTR